MSTSAQPTQTIQVAAQSEQPILSMTGFGSAHQHGLEIEIKTVNARFFEFHTRLPEELRLLEVLIREKCQSVVGRGKLECRISVNQDSTRHLSQVQINTQVLDLLKSLQKQVASTGMNVREPDFLELLRYPQLIRTADVDWQPILLETLDLALEKLIKCRQVEGKKLTHLLHQYLNQLESEFELVKLEIPKAAQAYRRKIQQQLEPLLNGDHVDARSSSQQVILNARAQGVEMARDAIEKMVEAEVLLHETRVDVSEEIDRLHSHIKAMRDDLNEGGAVGKKLDFLMQEFLREVNTLSSKVHGGSNAPMITHRCVEMKLCIEHMREQIQNLV